ncbi:MAG: hypothetical protein WC833_11270 [Bacteroidales bacterium]|jgi:hypothetical protein
MKPIYLFLLSVSIFATSIIDAKPALPAAVENPSYSALNLVKMAYRNVSRNYPKETNLMNAYYRESISKENSCILLSEAILDVNKASYLTGQTDKVVIKKAKGNQPVLNGLDKIMVKFQGGPNSALLIDVVKNPFLGAELYELNDKYEFRYGTPAKIDDVLCYVVEFDERYSEEEVLFRGKLYIEPNSLAIARIEFSRNVEKRGDAYLNFVKQKPASMKMEVKHANYVVNYKKYNNKWYFDYSTSDVMFNVKWNKNSLNSNYTLKSQMAMTNITTKDVKLDKRNLLKPSDIVADKVKEYNDTIDWDIYNLIMLIAAK